MLNSKKIITAILCVALLLNIAIPDFALDEETIESLRVEQASTKDYAPSDSSEFDLEENAEEESDVVETSTTEFVGVSTASPEDEKEETVVEETTKRESLEVNASSTEDEPEENDKSDVVETSTAESMEENACGALEEKEEASISETTFEENIENETNKKLSATLSEIVTEVEMSSDLGQPEDTEVKNQPKKNNNHVGGYKTPGFTVDVVERVKETNEDGLYGATNLPARYDAREHTNSHGVNIVPPVRNQNPYGTCWAHACIANIETSIRSRNLIASETDDGADLSEAALAMFTIEGLEDVTNNNSYIDYPGVESADFNCLNYDYYESRGTPKASMSFADCGENQPSAFLVATTYMGVIPESDCPHTEENIEAMKNELHDTGLANSRKPYAFNRNKYEVLNVDFLSKNDMTSIKEAIMKYGSVGIGYYEARDDGNCHRDDATGEWYYLSPYKAVKILDDGSCGDEITLGQNHAVTVVGWDDNVSYDKFDFDGEVYENRVDYLVASYSIINDDTGKYYPIYETWNVTYGHNGAWLVRNSWGPDADMHKDGYFWIPYYTLAIDDIFCAVDAAEANTYLYNYHYDTTSNLQTYNYIGTGKLANIFQVSHDIDQVLDAVSIAWKSANFDYDVYIYTNENQMNDPEDGTLMLSQTVHNGSAGIKTVPLNKSVLLPRDTYFSIIVKPNENEIHIFSEETFADPTWDRYYYNVVQLGESWENDNGTWRDLNTTPVMIHEGIRYGYSPRIRGLTDEARVITFSPGVGTGSMAKQGMKVGSTGKINSNEFTYDGHVFYKWIDEDGNEYGDGADITLSDNVILTAEWQEAPPTPPAPTPTPTPSPSPSRGGSSGSGGSGGGSGGGLTLPNDTPAPSITNTNSSTTITTMVDASQVVWGFNPLTNRFNLNINVNGQNVNAVNGFYALYNFKTMVVNGTAIPTLTQDIYFFDAEGSMVTGFVKTADGKTYFFENAKTKDEGKMVTGWKQIQNAWYYFNPDGSMLVDGVTPDGYIVGVDGRLIF